MQPHQQLNETMSIDLGKPQGIYQNNVSRNSNVNVFKGVSQLEMSGEHTENFVH